MTKKMLIDAAHPEEVRVALLTQGKIEDFDFESAAKKPLRGNIFLARVTRVEPSLQAAFVDYGGNRHGFLAFSEIHPDYYQIPVSDRELLQEAEKEVTALAAELELAQRGDDEDGDDADIDDGDIDDGDGDDGDGDDGRSSASYDDDGDDADYNDVKADDDSDATADDIAKVTGADGRDADRDDDAQEEEEEEDVKGEDDDVEDGDASEPEENSESKNSDEQPWVEHNDDDALMAREEEIEEGAPEPVEASDDQSAEAAPAKKEKSAAAKARDARNQLFERYKNAKRKRSNLLRNYKIQEVIKRRQILLIQVVKEERGNKGAALTTYLSLAGRYCVLMPNTARGGGISRKIAHSSDRRRLRRVVDSLDVPQGMGLIIRTAGAKRTKTEIKRDYDYLLRLWENIRTLTLKSIAPCLVYEEANLIKKAIRDLYDKDISKVLVEGEAGYREAKDFMKMLMPSHAKNVQPYKDPAPIFLRHGIESQLDGMYQPTVRLKSGGYIVIHQTEALIAIDVNSGRSTRERNIEQTALKTNIEAATEAARQFRLRDLAGLIVIDFIDMEEQKNNRKVEKALKEAMKHDRARVQVGRISSFGLLELSRQRRRSGIVDGTTQSCPTCAGAGVIRSHEIAALRILRAIEGEAISGKVGRITLHASTDVALHILNHNRDWIHRIEAQNGVTIEILADFSKAGDVYDLEKSGVPREREEQTHIRADQTASVETVEEDDDAEEEEVREPPADEDAEEKRAPGRKRRRRRRGGRKDSQNDDGGETSANADDASDDEKSGDEQTDIAASDEEKPKKRRRGRRGGRRNRRNGASDDKNDSAETTTQASEEVQSDGDPQSADAAAETPVEAPALTSDAVAEAPAPKKRTRKRRVKKADIVVEEAPASGAEDADANGSAKTDEQEPKAASEPAEKSSSPKAEEETSPKKPAKKGWWQRATG